MKPLSGKSWCASLLILAGAALHCSAEESLIFARLAGQKAPELIRLTDTADLAARSTLGSDISTPMGSLWKLFIYYYAAETRANAPAFTCRGASPEGRPRKSIPLQAKRPERPPEASTSRR